MFVKVNLKSKEFLTLIFPLVCIVSLEMAITLINKSYIPLIGLIMVLIICLIHYRVKNQSILENILVFGNYVYFFIMYGRIYCWVSIYFCLNQQRQSQILLVMILIILLVQTILQFEGLQTPTNIQFILITSIILISRVAYRFSNTFQVTMLKETEQEQEQINIEILDKSFKKTYQTTTNQFYDQENDNYDQFIDQNIGNKQVVTDLIPCIYKLYYNNDEQKEQNSQRKYINYIKNSIQTNRNKVVLYDIQSVIKEYLMKDPSSIQLILKIHKNETTGEQVIYEIKIVQKNQEYFVINKKVAYQIQIHFQNKNQNYKYKLVNIFTHKLKTPLNATLGYLSMVETEKFNLQQIKQHIKNAYINCRLQLYFVYDLLDYSLQNNEQINLSPSKINLKQMMNNLYDVIHYQCSQKDILINFMINTVDWKQVQENIYFYSDQLKLERILYNLLNDSYRKTNIGGQLSLNIQIYPDKYQFTITDNNLLNQNEIMNLNSQLKIQKQQNYNTNCINQKVELTTKLINQLIILLSDQQSQLTLQYSNQDQEMSYTFFIVSHQYSQNYYGNCSSGQIVKQSKGKSANQTVNSSIHCSPLIIGSFDEISEEPKIRCLPTIQHNSNTEVYVRKNRSKLEQKHNQLLQILESPRRVNSPRNRQNSMDIFRRLTIRQLQADSVELKIENEDIIMAVDDEPFNHDILFLMLQGFGFKKFMKAFNGDDCIQQIKLNNNSKIKAIIMDLDMPIMGGIQATKILVKMMKNKEIQTIPIIGCTAHDDVQTHQECYDAGMIFMVVKPIFKRTLKEAFLKIEEIYSDQIIKKMNSINNIENSQF